eukprot:1144668-Pelagomonas_calceolata.AAC.1
MHLSEGAGRWQSQPGQKLRLATLSSHHMLFYAPRCKVCAKHGCNGPRKRPEESLTTVESCTMLSWATSSVQGRGEQEGQVIGLRRVLLQLSCLRRQVQLCNPSLPFLCLTAAPNMTSNVARTSGGAMPS